MELTLQSSQQLPLHLNLPFNGLSGSKWRATWTVLATTSIFPSSLSRYAAIERNKHRVELLALAVIPDPELPLQRSERGFPQRGRVLWQEHLPQWRKTWGTGRREEGILAWTSENKNISGRAIEKAEGPTSFQAGGSSWFKRLIWCIRSMLWLYAFGNQFCFCVFTVSSTMGFWK